VLSESDDLVPAERVVQTPQGGKIATGGPAQDALQPDLHGPAIGSVQHVAELLFDLIGPCERAVVRQQDVQVGLLRGCGPLPGAQQQPALAPTDGAQLRSGTEEDFPAQLVEHLAGELGDVEGVVDDGRVLQASRVVDGVPVRAMHVHRDQSDGRLLLAREALEPAFERVFAASFADPERLAGLEVAHDGHELVVERVAPSEPLLVHADLPQGDGRPRRLPALEGLLFGATHGQPAQAMQGGDVHHGYRRGLHRQPLLKTARLALIGVRPRDHLHRRCVAARTLHAHGRVAQLHRVLRPRQVGPSSRGKPLVNVTTRASALATPRPPPALDDQNESGLAQHRQPADGRDALADADS
jgi:hypothetical protein